MEWSQVVVTAIVAASGLGGVLLGGRLSDRTAESTWTRQQRMTTYAAVLNAIDRQGDAFALMKAMLDLRGYDAAAADDPQFRGQMDAWGAADKALDEALPAAEFVASQQVQPHLIIAVRLGMRTRQRMLLMDLEYRRLVDEQAWKSVARSSLDQVDEDRRRLREDLHRTKPLRLRKSTARLRQLRRA